MNTRCLLILGMALSSLAFSRSLALGADKGMSLPPLVQTTSTTLELPQAIHLAIENNLDAKLAQAGTEEARGQAIQSAAALLPHLMGTMSQSRVFKVNLEAQGFPANNPFFSPILGPFNTFDARLTLSQKIFDLTAYWKAAAGHANEKVAQLQEGLIREQVAAAAALAYLEALRTNRALNAAQANLSLSESLFKLAHDQHQAGVATGVDEARAETTAAQEHLRLIRAQVTAHNADLRLKRLIGMPLPTPLNLVDLPHGTASDLPSVEKAISISNQNRSELQIADARLKTDIYSLRSAKAQHLPFGEATGDYGFSGNTPDGSARTGSIGGRLSLPIFGGGYTHGQVVAAAARRDESLSRYTDFRAQVEEDVRLSLQNLSAEEEETKTAEQAVSLAQRELKLAKDRFAAGVGDNIQLLSAQTAFEQAQDDQIDALARYDTARVNFATALGQMQSFQP